MSTAFLCTRCILYHFIPFYALSVNCRVNRFKFDELRKSFKANSIKVFNFFYVYNWNSIKMAKKRHRGDFLHIICDKIYTSYDSEWKEVARQWNGLSWKNGVKLFRVANRNCMKHSYKMLNLIAGACDREKFMKQRANASDWLGLSAAISIIWMEKFLISKRHTYSDIYAWLHNGWHFNTCLLFLMAMWWLTVESTGCKWCRDHSSDTMCTLAVHLCPEMGWLDCDDHCVHSFSSIENQFTCKSHTCISSTINLHYCIKSQPQYANGSVIANFYGKHYVTNIITLNCARYKHGYC